MPSSATNIISDLDDFRAQLRPTGGEIIATARGQFTATLTRVDFDRLWTQRTQESLPRLTHSYISPKRTGFSFLTHSGPGIIWNGIETSPSDIMMASSGPEFCLRLPGAPHWGGMSLPDEDLAEISATVAGRDLTPPPNAPPVTPPPGARGIAHRKKWSCVRGDKGF